ncbi:MAG: 7-cyano-7-deazaguanine synthase QueC [Planctomycetes bacterium]|nr:7-cyano-7-deazaguanine synthase QueC [Planctomycetota bacterium]
MKAVALLSGGLDSTVAFAMRARDMVLALTFAYGQRAATREIETARRIARRHDIPHRAVELPWLRGGSLTDRSAPLPSPDLQNVAMTRASAKAVWVPNRNGVMIAVGAAIAEQIGAGVLVVGFNREEAETFPDNSVGFLVATNRTLEYSTQGRVRVESPTIYWNKARIVREAQKRRIPLDDIWPCYEGGRRWCGRCESCLRALRAGVPPPAKAGP